MWDKILSLSNIRRLYGAFFFVLFIVLVAITDFRHMKGYEINLFLKIDPLIALSTLLSSWTLYKGLALSLVVIIPTLFIGRFFCSWVCPFGVLNQWVSRILLRTKAAEDYRMNTYRRLYNLKYYILSGLLGLAVLGPLQVGLFDPISLFTRTASTVLMPSALPGLYPKRFIYHGAVLLGLLFLAILFANRFIQRFWCRVLCPLGALLGLLSRFSLFRIWRDVQRCTDCMKCLRDCHGGCDPHRQIRYHECHLCMNCIDDCPEGAIHFGLQRENSSLQAPVEVNRRRLIETAVLGLALFPVLRGTVSASTRSMPSVIRPPGSIREKDFLRRCIKCGECMRVCPTNGIQPALLEAGFEGLWTPILHNRVGYCEFECVLCGHVCPTGAIRPLSVEEKTGRGEFKSPVKIGTAFYDRGRCLPWAMQIECIVCEEVCPTSPKAIWFEVVEVKTRDGRTKPLKRPHLDPKICIGCGICEYRCPVQDRPAIRVSSIGETRSKLNQMLLTGGEVRKF